MQASKAIFRVSDLEKVKGYTRIFHRQIVPQHGQFYLFNKEIEQSHCMQFNTDIYAPLNEANLLLGRFSKRLILKLKERDGTTETVCALEDLINQWQDCYNKGGVYRSYDYASKIVELLHGAGYAVGDLLRKEQQMISAFVNIPCEVKSQFQLGVMVEEKWLSAFFDQVTNLLSRDGLLKHYILQAKVSIPFATGGEPNLYRSIKFILNPQLIISRHNPVVKNIISLLLSVEHICKINRDTLYCHLYHDSLTVTQGVVNYKKFLKLLNILDCVYSPDYNYAYIRD